jgi:hypothetical protein
VKIARFLLAFCQLGMKHRNDLCAFPDSSGNTFHRARPDVADREDALSTCFQRQPISIDIGAGQYKPLTIQSDARSIEPIRVWFSANEKKQVPNGPSDFIT